MKNCIRDTERNNDFDSCDICPCTRSKCLLFSPRYAIYYCRSQAAYLIKRNNFRFFQLSLELKQTKIIPFTEMQRLRVAKQIFI